MQVLIYVFDVESQERETDIDYFRSCMEAIQQARTRNPLAPERCPPALGPAGWLCLRPARRRPRRRHRAR